MKFNLTSIFLGLVIFASLEAHASPEEDRNLLIKHFKTILPDINFEDYVYGSLAMNAQAMAQYESMMDFPAYSFDLAEGKKRWINPLKNGEFIYSCFKNGGINAASSYPYFDDKQDKVVTFENAINDCLMDNNENEITYGSREMTLLTAYAKSLSDGERINIKVQSPAALAAYEDGKQIFYRRQGQANFSCATCHVEHAGKFIRSEQLSMMIGQAAHWPEFRAGTDATSLQARFIQCQKSTRTEPYDYNSTEFNNLEYFMTYMSNGLKMLTPVFRK
jgi:sulfur-oxidizing protein SoxA